MRNQHAEALRAIAAMRPLAVCNDSDRHAAEMADIARAALAAPASQAVEVPASVEMAAGMVLAGMAWLKQHAPERLTPEGLKLQQMRGALEMAKNGLQWYAENHPELQNGCDDDAMTEIEAALALVEPKP